MHEWRTDNCFYLHSRDPDNVLLALTVMDEQRMQDDKVIGSVAVKLRDVLGPLNSSSSERDWEGWVNLTSKPATNKQGQITAGAALGGTLFGPAGAALGGLAGDLPIHRRVASIFYIGSFTMPRTCVPSQADLAFAPRVRCHAHAVLGAYRVLTGQRSKSEHRYTTQALSGRVAWRGK